MLGDVPWLARTVGAPLFPLLLFPFPLPSKFYIRFGPPIVLPGSARDADDQQRVDALNRRVRRRVQRLIDDTVAHRRGVIFSSYGNGVVARGKPPSRGR